MRLGAGLDGRHAVLSWEWHVSPSLERGLDGYYQMRICFKKLWIQSRIRFQFFSITDYPSDFSSNTYIWLLSLIMSA